MSQYAIDYIQLYGGDKALLMQSLDHIQKVAAEIIEALEAVGQEDFSQAA